MALTEEEEAVEVDEVHEATDEVHEATGEVEKVDAVAAMVQQKEVEEEEVGRIVSSKRVSVKILGRDSWRKGRGGGEEPGRRERHVRILHIVSFPRSEDSF